jgi:hypothetical protein
VEIVDWQMVMAAPVPVELGWFLVSNVNALPVPASDVVERYFSAVDHVSTPGPGGPGSRTNDIDSRARQVDLAILIGLLLRGWRKGADAEAGVTLASGVSADDDLAWWCDRGVDAADRIL